MTGVQTCALPISFILLPNPSENLAGRALSMTGSVVVNGYGDNIKEANEFAKFLTYDYSDDLYARTGKLPARLTGYVDGSGFSVFAKAYEQSIPMPKMVELSNFWMQLEITMRDIWEGAEINSSVKLLSERMMTQVTGLPYVEEKIEWDIEDDPEFTDGEIIEENEDTEE